MTGWTAVEVLTNTIVSGGDSHHCHYEKILMTLFVIITLLSSIFYITGIQQEQKYSDFLLNSTVMDCKGVGEMFSFGIDSK
jgi:hypothetical protein